MEASLRSNQCIRSNGLYETEPLHATSRSITVDSGLQHSQLSNVRDSDCAAAHRSSHL